MMNFVLFFLSLTVSAQSFLVTDTEERVGERILHMIDVAENLSNQTGQGCVEVEATNPIPEIERSGRTREVRSCYRVNENPKPFSGFLEPGQHMMMVKDNYLRKDPPFENVARSQLTGNYLLRNVAPPGSTVGRFQAILNVNFQGTRTHTTYMLNRTRECLNAMGPYLKGPNGESLEIKIVTPSDSLPNGLPTPTPINISVTREERSYRGHAAAFGTNFGCTTIGHEMLHHLGLCDEYHEGVYTNNGVTSDYSCRQVTAAPSYMRNIQTSFTDTVPQTSRCSCDQFCKTIMNGPAEKKELFLSQTGYEAVGNETSIEPYCVRGTETTVMDGSVGRAFSTISTQDNVTVFSTRRINVNRIMENRITCTCPPAVPFCQRIVNQLVQRSQTSHPRATCPLGTSSYDINPDPGGSGSSRVEGDTLIVQSPGTPGGSLLSPSHFYKILSGNCEGGSPQYERCGALAYVGPQSGTLGPNICQQVPPECSNDEYYLNGRPPVVRPGRR